MNELIDDYVQFYDENSDWVPENEGKRWKQIPRPEEFRKSLKFIDDNEKRSEHFDKIIALSSIFYDEIPYASTPKSFLYAYKNLAGKKLTIDELWIVKQFGANLIPLDPTVRNYKNLQSDAHSVFRASQTGFVYHPKGGGINVIRAGTAQGEYKDKANLETAFYDTARDKKNVMQCRYLEFLGEEIFEKTDSGFVIQMTVKLDVKTGNGNSEYSIANVACFCEVIPYSAWDDEMKSYAKKIYKNRILYPLMLRPLSVEEAKSKISVIMSLSRTEKRDFDIRTTLLTSEERIYWDYNNCSRKKDQRNKIRDYIASSEIKCAHHNDDKTKPCDGMTRNNWQVSHILSQSWSESYHIFKESVHHPDNLYLSCQSCNGSLGKGGPSERVLTYINKNHLTIGDLVRKGILETPSEE